MPSDTDVLHELDLGEPPQQLLDWAKENIRENPDTRCLILEDFRDMIYARGECTPHRTDDSFLLRFLRGRNFNVESAYRLTSFPMKIHAVHVVFQPFVFDIVYGMFKPFLTESMRNKIYFHGEDMESLHKHIHPKHLPERYGGRHPDYDYSEWIEGFRKNDKIMQELLSLGYGVEDNESEEYRSDSEKSEISSISD